MKYRHWEKGWLFRDLVDVEWHLTLARLFWCWERKKIDNRWITCCKQAQIVGNICRSFSTINFYKLYLNSKIKISLRSIVVIYSIFEFLFCVIFFYWKRWGMKGVSYQRLCSYKWFESWRDNVIPVEQYSSIDICHRAKQRWEISRWRSANDTLH